MSFQVLVTAVRNLLTRCDLVPVMKQNRSSSRIHDVGWEQDSHTKKAWSRRWRDTVKRREVGREGCTFKQSDHGRTLGEGEEQLSNNTKEI